MILILNDTPSFPVRTIGAYRIATVLREAGKEVEVIDYISRWEFDKLQQYIKSFRGNLEWIGISSKFKIKNAKEPTGWLTELSVKDELELINTIKQLDVPIVVGGPSIDYSRSSLPYQIDYAVCGYADLAILAIDQHIQDSTAPLTHKIYDNIKVIYADTDYANIDLTNIQTYYHESDYILQGESFPLEIGRGCMFKCAFCSFAHIGKKPGTYVKDIDSLKKEIIDRWEKYGSTTYFFLDDTFNESIEKMRAIATLREETGIPFEFWAYCRLDVLASQPEMVDLIDKIGWKSFAIGMETFNRDSGRAVGKGADPEKLKNFLKYLAARYPNIELKLHIIVGLPNDTKEALLETAKWFVDNPGVVDSVRFIGLNIYNKDDAAGRALRVVSKMSTDPGKFGYTTTPIMQRNIETNSSTASPLYNWKNNEFTFQTAREFATQLQAQVKDDISRQKKSKKWNMVTTDNNDLVKSYTTAKFKARGLLL